MYVYVDRRGTCRPKPMETNKSVSGSDTESDRWLVFYRCPTAITLEKVLGPGSLAPCMEEGSHPDLGQSFNTYELSFGKTWYLLINI